MIPPDSTASPGVMGTCRLAVLMQGLGRGLQGIKNDGFIKSLRDIYPSLEVWDIDLRGVRRLAAQARSFHPALRTWRSRFHAHPATFRQRTAEFERLLSRRGGGVDAFLQVGVLFDATAAARLAPLVVYTDSTTLVTAAAGRSFRLPFSDRLVRRRIAQERAALGAADRICTRSRFIADAIANGYGISPGRMEVVGGGGNVLPRPHAARDIEAQDPCVRFLFVGREFRRKGGDYVLQAFEKVQASLPETRLTMVTDFKPGASASGVRWLSGLKAAELAEEYAAAHIFVFAPRFDTWGDVLVEAMSAGLACICPDRPPFNEIVSQGVTGLCVGMEDQAALPEAMKRLAADHTARRELGKAARAAALANFSWDVVAAKLALEIDKACKSSVNNMPARSASRERAAR